MVTTALLLAVAIAGSSAKEDARRVLRRIGCQSCHDSDVSSANGDALMQFNLHDQDWSSGMTDRQLPLLLGRMKGREASDIRTVKRFIDAELRARKR